MQTLGSALLYAFVAIAAWRAPHLVHPRAFTIAAVAGVAAGTGLWVWGLLIDCHPLAFVSAVLTNSLGAWSVLLVGATLCTLGGRRDLIAAAVLGEVLGAMLRLVIPDFSLPVSVIVVGVVTLALLGVTCICGVPLLEHTQSDRQLASIATTNPESFLMPSHRLVVLVGFFEFMHGVVLAEGTTIFTLPTTTVSWLVILIGGLWVLLRRRDDGEDSLMVMASVLMVLGFSIQPLTPGQAVASQALSIAGASFSWMLLWASMAAVSMANPAATLWTFGMCYTVEALAMGAGSLVVALMGLLPVSTASVRNVMNALVVAAFLAFLLVGMRGFSFGELFARVRPVVEAPTTPSRQARQIAAACPLVAQHFGLTEREGEVLSLLAQGMGGPQIQEQLVIAQNTCKTHVRHIYRKLGVHSQQELIALVGEWRG